MTRADEVRWDADSPEEDESGRLAEAVSRLARPRPVAEAIAVASPSLARTLAQTLAQTAGDTDKEPAALRRALRALAGYRLRMASRETPFGLMSGVAPVRFGDDAQAVAAQEVAAQGANAQEVKVRWGDAHRRAVRPDRAWLTALVTEWEQRPEVLRWLRVVANGLCFVRDGRVVLPYLPHSAPGGSAEAPVREVSVRRTDAVALVMEQADTPVLCGELARRLGAAFPAAPPGSAEGMLVRLVAKGFLLSEAHPPLEAADPLDHLLSALAAVPPEDLPELPELRAIRVALGAYAALPLGAGLTALTEVSERMRGLRAADQPVHVDLALDAEARLPGAVAEEAARAAGLLWRLSPPEPGPAHLREYHAEFLERYGVGRPVPVRELLDPDIGLGAPAGYRCPPGPRPEPAEDRRDTARDEVLAALAQRALLAGEREILLSDDHPAVARLAHDGGRPPLGMDLCAHLLADTPEALAEGRFRLVLSSHSGRAGAMLGRFAHLLPEDMRASLTELARDPGPSDADADADADVLNAQVSFRTGRARAANIAQAPRLLEYRLPVGTFADRGDPAVLDLARLAVTATAERLLLVETRTGRRVRPAVFHLLDPEWDLPNAARLLCDLTTSGVRGWRGWSWGAAEALPYLPRVRYGRTVLAPARWRPDDTLRDRNTPRDTWTRAVAAWRDTWHVPRRVRVGSADRHIELDLDLPAHLDLLRHELGHGPGTFVQELPTAAGCGDGWLAGPDGVHRGEIVFPLLARTAATSTTGPRAGVSTTGPRAPGHPVVTGLPVVTGRPQQIRQGRREHLPGGEWLHASLYCLPARQNEVLTTHLPALLETLPPEVDRWFFVRYADSHDHLRLRWHGPAHLLTGRLLPQVHAFATALRDAGLTRRLVLDTYAPEIERYGGPRAMAAAERVFHTDSLAVLETLRLARTGTLTVDPLPLAAAGHMALTHAFFTGYAPRTAEDSPDPPGLRWLLETFPKDEAAHRGFRRTRQEALATVNPYTAGSFPSGITGSTALRRAWAARTEAAVAYGSVLRELGTRSEAPPTEALASLLHMHHNRLIGANPLTEQGSYAVARGAAQAHEDRRRASRAASPEATG
ncbi:lantibiotic dehydratase [Streptomyces paludis]|uniref:lantibiotic dehydratase n=1 Tax=Streptomyces paludis TaxID=2282738 RepID=UPI0013B3DAC5|nr:lantibiotic dehydratase [Streptomyces paludis]